MPKTAAKFGSELQLALQPMILKPSTAGGVQVGDEIPCLEWWITTRHRHCKKPLRAYVPLSNT